MKSQLILLVIVLNHALCIDLCRQFGSHEECIINEVDHCMWDNIRKACQQTRDYLQGCSNILNRSACVRQIGTVIGELAMCRFTTYCEEIPNLYTEKCSSNLSKYGCISILNKEEICEWVNGQCLTVVDKSKIQEQFVDSLYSASACQMITGYLIMHNSILWPLIDYSPDVITEALNQERIELDIEVDLSESYDDPQLVKMESSFGIFSEKAKQLHQPIVQLYPYFVVKISSRSRVGCIALEIENDNDYLNLFSLEGTIYGVNHIYCKYLAMNTQNAMNSAFGDGVCVDVSEAALRSDTFLSQNGIQCKSLIVDQCIFLESLTKYCYIMGDSYEYQCVEVPNITECENEYCTQAQCKLHDLHYINLETLKCERFCSEQMSQIACEQSTQCKWFNFNGVTVATYDYMLTCGPTSGCEHSGLGKLYCQLLSDRCQWNEHTQRCSYLTEIQISYYKCSDANNVLVCSLVSLSDQNCIWLKDRNQCINVSDNPLLKLHKLYNPLSAINKNLCTQFDAVLAQYNTQMRTCDIVSSITDFTLNNKYSCYSYSSLPCKWNLNLQKCECGFDASQLNCSEQRYVNEKVCQVAKVSGNQSGCLYNSSTRTCFETANYQTYGCADNGFNEEKCININKLGEYCQYEAGKCKNLSISYLNAILCPSLQKVNEQVCIQHQNLDVPCLYDQSQHSCYQPSVKSNNQCSEAMNRYACQQAQGTCYFNIIENKCIVLQQNEMEEVFQCENSYVSKEVCVNIKTKDQKCFWKDSQQKCFNYTDNLFNNCQEYETQPERVCVSLVTDISREFTKDKFCEYSNSKCAADVTTISDCGSDRLINIHRCSGFTTGFCLFIDSQCQSFDKNTRVGQLYLNQISCSQANQSMCAYITTPGQNCQWYKKVSGLLQDQKCGFADISYTSDGCNYGSTIVNPNACSLSSVYCYYDSAAQKCSTTNQSTFYCNSVGISQTICLKYSQGNCVWYENQCQNLNFNTSYSCSFLNLNSCKNQRYNLCMSAYDYSSCVSLVNSQTYTCGQGDLYISDNRDLLSKSICRLAQDFKCIQKGYGCKTIDDIDKLSCAAPLINSLVCLHLPLQYCEFFQNKCQDAMPRHCEQLSLTQCVQNIFYNCVIYNGQCITSNHTNIICSRYTQTNYKFCSQFSGCIYNSATSKCTQYIRNTDVSTTLDFTKLGNSFLCSTTYSNTPLIYNNSNCQLLPNSQTECPSIVFYANEATCNKFINCNFVLSKSFGGFCSTKPIDQLQCEDLTNEFCLIDLINSLKCYLNDQGNCTTYKTTINQYKYQMNYYLSLVFSDSCIFDSLSSKCKSKIFNQNDCLAALTEMECSLVNNTCFYNKSLCNKSGTFDQINRLGCISLTDSTYVYNFSVMKCQNITSQQQSCDNLNKQACITLTSTTYCQWYLGECRDTIDLISAQCSDLNYYNCIASQNRHCVWKNNFCEEDLTEPKTCLSQNSIYESSPKLCSKVVDVACVQNLDRKNCSTVSIKVDGCFGFGLNKIACLTMTKPYCYWTADDYCAVANLENIKCDDQVSQSTCLLITTPGQYCKWLDNKCVKIDSISTCDQANGMNGEQPCKAVQNEECEYNRVTYTCTKLQIEPIDCLDRYNEVACKLVQNKKCQFTNFTCNTQTISIVRCNSYLNYEQCMNLQTLPCQWQQGKCIDFISEMKLCRELQNIPNINAKSCSYYSIDPCTLVEDKCYPSITQNNFVQIYSFIDYGDQYDNKFIQGNCQDQKGLQDCVQSRIEQSCIWENQKCVIFSDFDDVTSCDLNFNRIACLKSRGLQQCSWQGECIQWSSPAPMTNININVCIENSINSIWQDYSCVVQDLSQMNCESIGISTTTCLALTTSECQVYLGKTCINFNESQEKNCYDYKLVSPYVCAKQERYSCVYDSINHSCRPFQDTDTIDTLGISKLACLSITTIKTFWKNTSCLILEEDIECDQNILVNSLACSSITAYRIPCMYDQVNFKCISLMNINALRCLTQGLNLYSCIQVKYQPCIFKDFKCQMFNEFDSNCITLSNVNYLSCASLTNQQCLYDQLGFKCYLPLTSYQQCNTVGLSQISCLNNSLCGWNQDTYSCGCKEQTKLNQCQYSSAQDCDANSYCIWDYGKCVIKQCNHQKLGECQGTLFNKLCYLTKSSNCQPAQVCEDIIDSDLNCSEYYFNGIACQGTQRQCYSPTNLVSFCSNSIDCLNENCISQQGSCRIRFCSDIRNESQCFEKSNCVFFNGECVEIKSCSDILNLGETDQEKLCNKAVVNGLKCNWQKAFIVDNTLTCTNKACDFYGASQKLCQGNESNNYACVLTYDSNCISCELIQDSCFCKSQVNVCKYENSQCQSILCSDYVSAPECSQKERCYWSEALGKCSRTCYKLINEDECNERTGECHYDSLMMTCKQGVEAIPDTAIIIELEDVGDYFLTALIIIGMIIS